MKFGITILLIASIMVFVYSQIKYDANTNLFKGSEREIIIPSSKTLRIASLGNINFVADMMYIWAIQFFATVSIKNRYDYAYKIFDIITDLNPKFEAVYNIGATIIGLNAKNPRMAIKLLQKAKKHIKNNYFFDYDSGYFAWFYLKDYKLAKKYYLQMAEYKNLPDMLKDFWVSMDMKIAEKISNKGKALEIWKVIEKNATWKSKKESAKAHILQLKYEIDKEKFKNWIKEFKIKYGRFPLNLKELKNKLRLKNIPSDYIGNPYKYNPKTGMIILEMEESWKKFL